MSEWVRLCSESEAPVEGAVAEFDVAGVAVCVAHVEGGLRALDNWCPHRRGPLGEGWLEGNAVVCPWHCWAFDVETGRAQLPEDAKVAVFPVRIQNGDVLVNIG